MKKRIAISVTNDTYTDQRVRKQIASLQKAGFAVTVYGRKTKKTNTLATDYKLISIEPIFHKKVWFYAIFNIKLFFHLLFSKTDVFYANDLDTLTANGLAATIRRKPLIYDSHEYFTEVPEIQNKPTVKKVWKFLERMWIKKCDMVLTVSPSIAQILKETYQLKEVHVVRNLPAEKIEITPKTKAEIGVIEDVFLIVLQGAGINIDRGGEELVEAMTMVENAVLLIMGGGDAWELLKSMVKKHNLEDKVIFKSKMPFRQMMQYTAAAQVGVSLDKDTNLNYRYSLPNKIFDYAMAGVPIIASNLVEVRKVIEHFEVGLIVDNVTPKHIAAAITHLQQHPEKLMAFKANTKSLVNTLTWESDFKVIIEKIKNI